MAKPLSLFFVVSMLLLCGCVEREIEIITEPAGADVFLNGEHIGLSPVTARFNWYGTYDVQLKKQGYCTLNTPQKIERPRDDYFPFDIFASDVLHKYSFSYSLEPQAPILRDELIESAIEAAGEADKALGGIGGTNE